MSDPSIDRRLIDAEWKGEVKQVLKAVHADVKEIKTMVKISNKTIGSLEKSRNWTRGVAAVFGAIGAWIATNWDKFIHHDAVK